MTDKPTELRPNYYRIRVPVTNAEDGTAEVECLDIIDALGLGFYEGNVLKYLFRCGRKNPDPSTDLLKLRTYAQWAQERARPKKWHRVLTVVPATPPVVMESVAVANAATVEVTAVHGLSMRDRDKFYCKCGFVAESEEAWNAHMESVGGTT